MRTCSTKPASPACAMPAACCAPSVTGLAQTREVLQIGAELYGDAEHRGRPGSARSVARRRSTPPPCAACTSTSATSASIARWPTARALPATPATARTVRGAAQQDVPAVAELTPRACPRPGATHSPRCRRCTGRRTRCSRRRARLPDTPSIAGRAVGAGNAGAGRAAARSKRCTSISPICAAITTRPARASRCSPPAKPTRSAAASATTASARRSAALVRRRASRSTCASSRALSGIA